VAESNKQGSMYGLLGFKQKMHLDWGSKILLVLKQKLYSDWSSKGLALFRRCCKALTLNLFTRALTSPCLAPHDGEGNQQVSNLEEGVSVLARESL
jgi:hypothetical protein